MRIFKTTPKTIEHARISPLVPQPYREQLKQAKGVMENYLKDKALDVYISPCSLVPRSSEFDSIQVMGHNPAAARFIKVKKEGDTPFLRRVYSAIETIAHEFKLNNLI